MKKLYVVLARPNRNSIHNYCPVRIIREFPEKVPVTIELLEEIEAEEAKDSGFPEGFVLTLSWQWLDE